MSNTTNKTHVTINLERNLAKTFKAACAKLGITQTSAINQIVTAWLKSLPKK